jgi:3-methyladenine DNA glycosylase AlkD
LRHAERVPTNRPSGAPAPSDLRSQLDAESDPAAAAVFERYFQAQPGGYGDGDVFLGVKLSRLRDLAKPYRTLPFVAEDWLPLLKSPIHEHRLAALVVMAERAKCGAPGEREMIYQTYLDHTAYLNNWDLVDVSCAWVVGHFLLDHDRSPLYRLACSRVVWDRRIAIVSTHAFLRAGQSEDTYKLAVLLLDDDHDLIHKAVGWMLREAGKRVSRKELEAFLDRHAAVMPRTMLRYAIEHFEPDRRTYYLAQRRQ